MNKSLLATLLLFSASLSLYANDRQNPEPCCICGYRAEASQYVNDYLFSQTDKGNDPAFCCYPCCFSFKSINTAKLVGMETQFCDGCVGKNNCYCCPSWFFDCSIFACLGCTQGVSFRQCFCGSLFDDTGFVCEANNICRKSSGYSCGFRCAGCDEYNKQNCCRGLLSWLGNCMKICCLAVLDALANSD